MIRGWAPWGFSPDDDAAASASGRRPAASGVSVRSSSSGCPLWTGSRHGQAHQAGGVLDRVLLAGPAAPSRHARRRQRMRPGRSARRLDRLDHLDMLGRGRWPPVPPCAAIIRHQVS